MADTIKLSTRANQAWKMITPHLRSAGPTPQINLGVKLTADELTELEIESIRRARRLYIIQYEPITIVELD